VKAPNIERLKAVRLLLIVLQTFALLFLIMAFFGNHDDRRLARAVVDNYREPSADHKRLLEEEATRVHRSHLLQLLIPAGLIAGNTWALVLISRRLRVPN
jgi:hypothetical protein